MKPGLKMTMMAQEAMNVSEHLALKFLNRTVGESPAMRLTVSTPDGPSTDGGKRARQALSLAPVHEPTGGSVMIGWLDVAQSRAELRAFHVVNAQHQQRYGTALSVSQPEYDELMEDVSKMLQARKIQVEVLERLPQRAAPEAEATAVSPASTGSGVPGWVWAVAGLLVGAGGVAVGAVLF